MGDDRQWRLRLHQTRGAVDGGDDQQPGYQAASYRGTALRATAVPGATVGHNAVVALGVAAFGVAEFIVYPELWGRGGHMGSFLQIPTQSAQALFAL